MDRSVVEMPVRLSVWDRAGIWLSGVCVVHCVTLPVVLLLLPLWPVLEPAHDWVHPAFAALLMGTTLPAAWSAWRRHGSPSLSGLLLAGLGIVLVAMLIGNHAGMYAEDGITLVGSGLLIVGHWKNGRACARGACRHPH